MRTNCITTKVRTDFGNCYIHVDLNAHGVPKGGRISTPGKEPNSQIHKLVEQLSYGLNEALGVV